MLKRERVLRKPDPEATALMNEWQVSMMPPS
jgi:hypothetical protein